ncbi:primosomal protein N' [Nocardia sp. NPDC058705]|uniref:primosomal protein N' n=1 Tax=Nocardia sp. NPDC058705 TaxID=3346609 RepID=UPI003676D942
MPADDSSTAAGHPIARVLPLLSPAHLDRDFDYLVPAELDEIAQPGVRVRVRFAGRLVDGYLLERLPRSDHNGKMMPLERIVSPERVLTPDILRLATAVAARYAGTRADVLRLAIPPRHARTETGGVKKSDTAKKPKVSAPDGDKTLGDEMPPEIHESSSAAAESARIVDASAWGRYVHGTAFVEALAQGKGARAAWQALPGEDWAARLAELAATVAASGRSAVLMVPDQRDLDRLLAECVALVGDSAVGLSAGLGPAARYRRWLAVLRGQARIVVGTRAAVFAPARDLGLIAIWDDGDDTYAEPRSPYPHAREVAMLRAHETGAAFVAAGFARTAEIQAVVESGWARDLLAPREVLREVAPRISAPGDSDFALERDALARSVRMPGVAFAAARSAIKENVAVLVQVPRRGYVPSLACAKCRTPARCRHCNGPLALPHSTHGEAASPQCKWCGITEAAFRCQACGARALRATVIGAGRTAEELGRAFSGVPIRTSGGGDMLDTVEPGAQVVVATVGAEPVVPGGYGVALLLDGWALLGRADLRASEDTLRRWMGAAALVRPRGQVIVMAEPSLPTVQALVRWDPVNHAAAELEARAEVGFPPAVRLAAVDGTSGSIAELLDAATLPEGTEILGPVPLPPTARKPFSGGDAPAEVERMLLRVGRSEGGPLARALAAAQAVRSTHRSDAPLRVQVDPVDIG